MYSVVLVDGKGWIVRRNNTDLARRSHHSAARALAAHLAWRECSRSGVCTAICELNEQGGWRRVRFFEAGDSNFTRNAWPC